MKAKTHHTKAQWNTIELSIAYGIGWKTMDSLHGCGLAASTE